MKNALYFLSFLLLSGAIVYSNKERIASVLIMHNLRLVIEEFQRHKSSQANPDEPFEINVKSFHRENEAQWNQRPHHVDGPHAFVTFSTPQGISMLDSQGMDRLKTPYKAGDLDASFQYTPNGHVRLVFQDQTLRNPMLVAGDPLALGLSETTNEAVAEIGRAVQQECRDRSRMPSSA
eukprot:TRINITY_DN11890_c0_g1_i3.p1 TRINITY_DN11890_c0_g1~~TRINITY_DN11890_c0_g1_i3.p1  ORF type:complete len:178 (+),score=16.54 TRINITY_DN11890_c0_g1_i3:21-554(+)